MKQYLLSIYQPDGTAPPPEVLEPIMRDLAALERGDQARPAPGSSPAGLHPPEHGDRRARRRDGEVLITDGPFTEGKEHIGGFTVIRRRRPRRGAGVGRPGWRASPPAADRGAALRRTP